MQEAPETGHQQPPSVPSIQDRMEAIAVYPFLRPHFGGGGPREVTLQVDGPSGPETMDVLLVKKVETGYYYIQKNTTGERATYFGSGLL